LRSEINYSNLKINISVTKYEYIFEFKSWYFNLRNIYVNLNFIFAFWFFLFNWKSLFECKNCYSKSKTFYLNPRINIWTLEIVMQIWKLIFQYWNFLFQFWKLYLNLKIVIPILKHFIWIKNQYLNLRF